MTSLSIIMGVSLVITLTNGLRNAIYGSTKYIVSAMFDFAVLLKLHVPLRAQ